MYTLIGSPMTRAFRVLWTLEELAQDYELLPVAPRSKEINKLNPSGKVPALLVDDEVLLDSLAICQYLADKHGAMTYAAGTIERAHQDSWSQFAMDELDSILWTAAKHRFVLPEQLRLADVREVSKFEIDKSLKTLETRLGDKEFVMGDQFTIPDMLICHCANWIEFGKKWPLPEGPVKAYISRLRRRPAFLKAMKKRKAA
jgi:glutathione S-transferase